jgi:cytochrome c
MKQLTAVAALALMSAPAFAQDIGAGQEQFERQCVACHVVVNDAGETLAGRNAKTGPNLYGIVGRVVGSVPDFDYGDGLIAYGETGAVWEEENFVAYVQNPTDFLREVLEDRRARGKMAFQVRDAAQAADIYAYLASLTPAAE